MSLLLLLLFGLICCFQLKTVFAQVFPVNQDYTFFDTGTPPDPFGLDGFDVFQGQSVAVRFYSNIGGVFSSLRVWMMNNGGSLPYPTVNIALLAGNQTAPPTPPPYKADQSGVVELFSNVEVPTLGWDPVEVNVTTALFPLLDADKYYWVVMDALTSGPGADPIWLIPNTNAYTTTTGGDGNWQAGAFSMTVSIKVVGFTPPMMVAAASTNTHHRRHATKNRVITHATIPQQ